MTAQNGEVQMEQEEVRREGGPAFPVVTFSDTGHMGQVFECGMTLRDWFAGQAIGPLMGSDGFESQILAGGFSLDDLPRFAAKQAYEIADAMLKERSK